jgi:hypothetical protein
LSRSSAGDWLWAYWLYLPSFYIILDFWSLKLKFIVHFWIFFSWKIVLNIPSNVGQRELNTDTTQRVFYWNMFKNVNTRVKLWSKGFSGRTLDIYLDIPREMLINSYKWSKSEFRWITKIWNMRKTLYLDPKKCPFISIKVNLVSKNVFRQTFLLCWNKKCSRVVRLNRQVRFWIKTILVIL